jgi:hypothetical protein
VSNPRWKTFLLIAAVWAATWMVLTAQLYLTVVPRGLGISFTEVAETQFLRVALWALFTPLVLLAHRRLPFDGRRDWLAFTVHLTLSIAAMFANYLLRLAIDEVTGATQRGTQDFSTYAVLLFNGRNFVDIFIYWMIIGARHIHGLYVREQAAAVAQAQLQAQLVEAEMHALKQQLQPHFLFNALNAVAMLVRDKQEERAVDTLAQLSALLRRLIDNTREQQVTLARELDFTQRYLEIEQVRFGDRLQVRYQVDDACLKVAVPSLLLQPLVENAVKHGISKRSAQGRVDISARFAAGRLELVVFNDKADTPDAPVTGTHIGMATTRDRLQKTYGADYSLVCQFNQTEGSRVKVSLPLRTAVSVLPVNPPPAP